MLAAISRSPMRTARSSSVTIPVSWSPSTIGSRRTPWSTISLVASWMSMDGVPVTTGVVAWPPAGVAVGEDADGQVAVGDEADRQARIVDQDDGADVALAHELGHVAHRRVRRGGDHRLRHDLADPHGSSARTLSIQSSPVAPPTPTQLAWRGRIEAALRVGAPFLDLLLAAGDRLSRAVDRDAPDPPPRSVGPTPGQRHVGRAGPSRG